MNSASKSEQILTLPVLVGGALVLAVALLTRMAVGSPFYLLHKLNATGILPPVWCMSVLWMSAYALSGAVAGYLLSRPTGNAQREACLWRGCTFLILAIVFSLVWYTLLFGKHYLIPSWLCLLMSGGFALICVRAWWSIGKWAALIALGFTLWQICLFFLQFAVIMHA